MREGASRREEKWGRKSLNLQTQRQQKKEGRWDGEEVKMKSQKEVGKKPGKTLLFKRKVWGPQVVQKAKETR